MWFNKNDLTYFPLIRRNDIKGYVLPHAGTKIYRSYYIAYAKI